MAKIPVEKKSGTSWWAWILGLLVLLALIWLLAELFTGDDVDDVEPVGQVEQPVDQQPGQPAAATGLITSVATLLDAPDREALAGREVQLSNLRVTSVVGDSTFYVTPDDAVTSDGAETTRRFFVALDEEVPSPPQDVEGRYDVTEGQLISLSGTVREIMTTDPGTWGITGADAEQMMDDAIYLRAQQLTIEEEAG